MEPRYKNGKESVSDDPRVLSWENGCMMVAFTERENSKATV